MELAEMQLLRIIKTDIEAMQKNVIGIASWTHFI